LLGAKDAREYLRCASRGAGTYLLRLACSTILRYHYSLHAANAAGRYLCVSSAALPSAFFYAPHATSVLRTRFPQHYAVELLTHFCPASRAATSGRTHQLYLTLSAVATFLLKNSE